MAKDPPKLVPLQDLMVRARFHETGAFGALYYRSLPMPTPGPDGPAVVYFFGPAERVAATDDVPAHVRLGTPTHVATLDADTGRFRELRVAAPAEVGVAEGAPPWLGTLPVEPVIPPEEFAARRVRLLALCDALAPHHAVRDEAVPWAVREQAVELLANFDAALEPPLTDCYRAAAAPFLQWAARVAAEAR